MRVILLCSALLAGCAQPAWREPPHATQTALEVYAQPIDLVRAATYSSLLHMGMLVRVLDMTGRAQQIVARGHGALIQVDLEPVEGRRATRMHVGVLAAPHSVTLARFVDGVDDVLRPARPGNEAPGG